MKMRKTIGTTLIVLVATMVWAGTTILAHEVTYKGTVIATQTAKVQVKVIDEKSKKDSSMEFSITEKTKVLRGDAVVTFATANIKKDERIAVTVNHDGDATVALVIRLAAPDAR